VLTSGADRHDAGIGATAPGIVGWWIVPEVLYMRQIIVL
jgi:hypothetical protein